MDLKTDKSFCSQIIYKVCGHDAIYPCADRISKGFYPKMVPFIILKRSSSFRISGNWIYPAPSRFIINTTSEGARSGICFYLVTVNTTIPIIRKTVASDLNTGIKSRIYMYFIFQNKICIDLLRT